MENWELYESHSNAAVAIERCGALPHLVEQSKSIEAEMRRRGLPFVSDWKGEEPTGLSVEVHPWPAGETPLVVVHEAGRGLLEDSNNTQEGTADETRDRNQEDPG